MSSTPNLGLVYNIPGQLQPEVPINGNWNTLDGVLGPAVAFGYNPASTTGLTYGYFGGKLYSNGANITVNAGTVALTASATSYVQRTAAGIVSVTTAGFSAGLIPMATIVTSATGISTITDNRPTGYDLRGAQSIALAGNLTLTDSQANNRILTFTGALTANVVVTFPKYQQEWIVSNQTTGAYTLQIETSGGTAVTITQGQAEVIYGDGANLIAASGGAGGGMSNPMTTINDLIVGASSGAPTRLASGAAGQVLTSTAGGLAWQNNPAAFTNPMTTVGDLILGGAGGSAGRLGAGASGQVLTINSTTGLPDWENSPAGFSNPMTAAGDLIVGGAGGTATRLGSGSVGQVLSIGASGPQWSSASGSSPPALSVNAQTSGAYTLALTDAPAANGYQGVVTMNNAAANTLTVPPNSSVAFPAGTQLQVVQLGAGKTAVAAGVGVTISTPSTLTARAQYSSLVLTQVAADVWVLAGDMT